MKLLLLVLCLVENTWAKEWSVVLETTPLTIVMDETVAVPFSVTIPENTEISSVHLAINNSDFQVTAVNVQSFYSDGGYGQTWNSSVNVTGLFIGNSRISLSFSQDKVTSYRTLIIPSKL